MIRDAVSCDYPAIRAIARHAFGKAAEANLVERLRDEGDVLVELVAGDELALQGHILYSRLVIERARETIAAAALAPVAVLPAFQRRGIGRALIEAGSARCAALGVAAIIVLGHRDYYPRFGFSAAIAESLEAPFSGSSLMALELISGVLQKGGRVRYAAAFGV